MMEEKIYGDVQFAPLNEVTVGSYGTWTITYIVGKHGMDNGGRLLVSWRTASDWGEPQFEHPTEPNYTTVFTSGQAKLKARFDPKGYIRPWGKSIVIDVYDGFLQEGETISIVLGDRSQGSLGSRVQTFSQANFHLLVSVDPFGTGEFVTVGRTQPLRVVSGEVARLVGFAPSNVQAGEPFAVTVRVEDEWGNLCQRYSGKVQLRLTGEEQMLLGDYSISPADGGYKRFTGITVETEGVYRLEVRDEDRGIVAESNPVVVTAEKQQYQLFWGDLHGQTESTVGTGTVDEYFSYARGPAALDFCAHQGNDFQITPDVWQEIKAGVKKHHTPKEFITFLGYEWSANTPAGGDHNVYFLGDDEEVLHSSLWQVDNTQQRGKGYFPLPRLWEAFAGRDDVLIIPHIGGRPANLEFHNPHFTPLIEVCSNWGFFQWFIDEALERGLEVGFVGGGDDHTGRPGRARPINERFFSVTGGLVGVYSTDLTREALWEALKARRCYATTGERIILWVESDGYLMGSKYETAMPPTLKARVIGTNYLDRVELVRGKDVIYSYPLISTAGTENDGVIAPGVRQSIPGDGVSVENAAANSVETGITKVRFLWSGVRARSRHLYVDWDGGLSIDTGNIVGVEEVAIEHPDDGIIEQTPTHLKWRSTTSGDEDGIIVSFNAPPQARITFCSRQITFTVTLGDIGDDPIVYPAGGIDQKVEVRRFTGYCRVREVSFTYRDDQIREGVNPYYIRVVQQDGSIAWSSPVFVAYKRRS